MKIFLNNKLVRVPETISSLSTSKLLTMTWLEGKPLNNFYKSSNTFRPIYKNYIGFIKRKN